MTPSKPIRLGWMNEEGMFFKVPSTTTDDKYTVHIWFNDPDYKWICNCLGNKYGHKCKHIKRCENILAEVLE